MRDIGMLLSDIMEDTKCSSICAFFLLSEKKVGDSCGVHKLQPKSETKTSGRLCYSSDIQNAT